MHQEAIDDCLTPFHFAECAPGAAPMWRTSSFGETAETSRRDLLSLRDHLKDCRSVGQRLFRLRCAADTLADVLDGRFLTIVLVMAFSIFAAMQC